jgi:hypothetical protein
VPLQRGVFSKRGELWTIGLDGESFCLKHTKGLAYLARLLRVPDSDFHVLDLIGGIASDQDDSSLAARASATLGEMGLSSGGVHIGSLGDVGEMLDDEAKVQYKARIAELRQDLSTGSSVTSLKKIFGATPIP